MINNEISLYVHIPFCKKKCRYCDFLSFSDKDEYIDKYIAALIEEINEFETDKAVKSVFFGGGTPSVLEPEMLDMVLKAISDKFQLRDDCEITLEANPATFNTQKLRGFLKAGINRLSIGVQSFDDDELRFLGRIHNALSAEKSIDMAKEAGFENISLDLIFSLPNQSLETLKKTLEKAVNSGVKHISAYSLIIEENTPLFDMLNNNEFKPLDDDKDRELYYFIRDYLKENGFMQYEISNFAVKGFESRHNLTYWRCTDYKGFGLNAHSLIDNKRFHNTENLNKYLSGNYMDCSDIIELSKEDRISEFVFLGLRCTDGISKSEFKDIFDIDIHLLYNKQINKLISDGLLVDDGDRLFLTPRGIDISNLVFAEFI